MAQKQGVLDKNVAGDLSIIDGALIGVAKVGSETVMSMVPFVGNATWRSGLIKSGAAVLGGMSFRKSKTVQVIASGMLIDGMEDIAIQVKKMIQGKATNDSDAQGVETFE